MTAREEFDNNLKRANLELDKLRSKVSVCDLEDILEIAGESQKHLSDARVSLNQALRELTYDGIRQHLTDQLSEAESRFDDIQIDFEVDCRCPIEKRRSDLTDVLSGKLRPLHP